IPVETIEKVPGAGNASNNAVGSAKLGMKTAIVSILGGDDIGSWIINHWKRQGIATRYATVDRKQATNYNTVLTFQGERTILVHHEHRAYKFPARLDRATWLYYASLGRGSESMHKPLLAYLKKTRAKFAFQPGTFQLLLGLEGLRPLIAASHVVIMNKE